MNDRNKPCPCGSGKKYKKCHLAADTERARAERQASSPQPQTLLCRAELRAEMEADLAEQEARWDAHPALELLDDYDLSDEECEVLDRADEAGGAEGAAIKEAYCQAHPDSHFAWLCAADKGPEAEARWLAKYEHVWADKQQRINQVYDDLCKHRISRQRAEEQWTALYGRRTVIVRATGNEVIYELA